MKWVAPFSRPSRTIVWGCRSIWQTNRYNNNNSSCSCNSRHSRQTTTYNKASIRQSRWYPIFSRILWPNLRKTKLTRSSKGQEIDIPLEVILTKENCRSKSNCQSSLTMIETSRMLHGKKCSKRHWVRYLKLWKRTRSRYKLRIAVAQIPLKVFLWTKKMPKCLKPSLKVHTLKTKWTLSKRKTTTKDSRCPPAMMEAHHLKMTETRDLKCKKLL